MVIYKYVGPDREHLINGRAYYVFEEQNSEYSGWEYSIDIYPEKGIHIHICYESKDFFDNEWEGIK